MYYLVSLVAWSRIQLCGGVQCRLWILIYPLCCVKITVFVVVWKIVYIYCVCHYIFCDLWNKIAILERRHGVWFENVVEVITTALCKMRRFYRCLKNSLHSYLLCVLYICVLRNKICTIFIVEWKTVRIYVHLCVSVKYNSDFIKKTKFSLNHTLVS